MRNIIVNIDVSLRETGYAMRSKLGLPNSSNPAERCNNLVTARRQKHHGMSGSEKGSYALTS